MDDLRALARMSTPPGLRSKVQARLGKTPRGGRCEVVNADGAGDGPAVLRIYDEIHWLFGVSAEQVADELTNITADEIRVEINSPGGDVFDGLAIYNSLRAHPARITTRVDGIAASAASVIVQAGDRRLMMSSAQQMIHEAWGLTVGPAGDHREMADLLDKQNDVIAAIYAARSGNDADEFRETMRSDTYLTDQEAVDMGLADEIVDPPRKDKQAADAIRQANPNPAVSAEVLAEQLKAALTDNDLRLELGLPPIQKIPPAGEREDDTDETSEPSSVPAEQAKSLLGLLTLNRSEEDDK